MAVSQKSQKISKSTKSTKKSIKDKKAKKTTNVGNEKNKLHIQRQRKKAILKQRLKVPPGIHQFSHVLDKSLAYKVFEFLDKYRPETKLETKQRLATSKEESNKKECVEHGLNHITSLVEKKKAQLVLIASDVDPIELVVWLPTLCRKMDIPYAIVHDKARLGTVVHKKRTAVLAITNVRSEDKAELSSLISQIKKEFNDRFDDIRKQWGGGVLPEKQVSEEQKILEQESDPEL